MTSEQKPVPESAADELWRRTTSDSGMSVDRTPLEQEQQAVRPEFELPHDQPAQT